MPYGCSSVGKFFRSQRHQADADRDISRLTGGPKKAKAGLVCVYSFLGVLLLGGHVLQLPLLHELANSCRCCSRVLLKNQVTKYFNIATLVIFPIGALDRGHGRYKCIAQNGGCRFWSG
jgi:hypothetical protein